MEPKFTITAVMVNYVVEISAISTRLSFEKRVLAPPKRFTKSKMLIKPMKLRSR